MQKTYNINPKLLNNLFRFISLVDECDLPYELEYRSDYDFSSVLGSNIEYYYDDSFVDNFDSCLSLRIFF